MDSSNLPRNTRVKIILVARPLFTPVAQNLSRCELGVFTSRTCVHSHSIIGRFFIQISPRLPMCLCEWWASTLKYSTTVSFHIRTYLTFKNIVPFHSTLTYFIFSSWNSVFECHNLLLALSVFEWMDKVCVYLWMARWIYRNIRSVCYVNSKKIMKILENFKTKETESGNWHPMQNSNHPNFEWNWRTFTKIWYIPQDQCICFCLKNMKNP
jgi:hypothetical protein